ncbi:MAG TPA: helix-turn-helix domain-containing protein [Denitromonas sp.]|uniref:ArsR/SmtB family transcription factor n=1 Tax=Denitromonas sp. TaxID=2734609 RepID=UPI001D6AA5FB|nr:winged helix-turn-helix transcriptional regulator [Rhodocyclaceae bacterium]MCP5222847.1 winged helix-turn-helix transcriptional regulator [Zoogloeaceae bacterium]HPR07376.1 helix-turn-helix domain-containing protein [Denitromonas sp.]HQU87899.1 helix-turn-helix domain-containing protein [Denitromonas sp.]HQV14026.1 helix-turn-helix domain-containing protein [Denitromonas sp.]
MEIKDAAQLLSALGHDARLSIFRLLVEAGPAGLNAGAISDALAMPPASASFHLAHLSRVGLIQGQRAHRFIHYSANFSSMDALIVFLTRNCCQGEACLPLTAACDTRDTRRAQPAGD